MCGRREPGPPLDCIDIWSKAVELVNMGLQQTMGSLFHRHLVAARTDIPQPTDVNAPPPIAKTNMCSLASRKVVAMAAEVNSPSASWKSTTSSPSLRGNRPCGKPAVALWPLQPGQGEPFPGTPVGPPAAHGRGGRASLKGKQHHHAHHPTKDDQGIELGPACFQVFQPFTTA